VLIYLEEVGAVIRDFVYVGKPKSKLSMRWASFGLAFLRNPAAWEKRNH